MKQIIAVVVLSLFATGGAQAANWTGTHDQSFGDKCKKNPAEIIAAVPGAGYTVITKEKHSPLAADFNLCVKRKSNSTYEIWQFQSTADTFFCRTATRLGMNSTCSNNTLP